MAHHSHDRCTRLQILLPILLFADLLRYLDADKIGCKPVFIGHNFYGIGIQTLIDGDHHSYAHAGSYNLVYRYVHHGGQLVGCHKFGQFKHLALSHLLLQSLLLAHLHLLTLVLAIS